MWYALFLRSYCWFRFSQKGTLYSYAVTTVRFSQKEHIKKASIRKWKLWNDPSSPRVTVLWKQLGFVRHVLHSQANPTKGIFVKTYVDDVCGSTRLFPHGIWNKGFFIFSKTIAREDTEVNFVKTGMYVSDVPQIVSFPMEFGSKLFYFL